MKNEEKKRASYKRSIDRLILIDKLNRNEKTHSFQHLLHLKNENLIHTYIDFNLKATKQNVCVFKTKKGKLYFLLLFIAISTAVAI
jgi:hypothetical protein